MQRPRLRRNPVDGLGEARVPVLRGARAGVRDRHRVAVAARVVAVGRLPRGRRAVSGRGVLIVYVAPAGPSKPDAAPTSATEAVGGFSHAGSTATVSPGSRIPFWFDAAPACASTARAGASGGCQPSWTTSKSFAVNASKAGLSTSLSQRSSQVPLMYMSEPLSATIRPYRFIARKIFWISGAKPEMSLPAFSRSRAPIGSAGGSWNPARCDRRVDVPVGVAHGEPERVPDLVGPVDLVVAHEARQDREPAGVGGSPALRPAVVGVQVEEGARVRLPLRAVPPDVVELVEIPVVAVDDQHVAIDVARVVDVSGVAALDPVRLRDRRVGNRIEGVRDVARVRDAVAFSGSANCTVFLGWLPSTTMNGKP